jgi:hypothetical protein
MINTSRKRIADVYNVTGVDLIDDVTEGDATTIPKVSR